MHPVYFNGIARLETFTDVTRGFFYSAFDCFLQTVLFDELNIARYFSWFQT